MRLITQCMVGFVFSVFSSAQVIRAESSSPKSYELPSDFFERCTPFQKYEAGTAERPKPGGSVTFNDEQRKTLAAIVERLRAMGETDGRVQGYVLATVFRETASTLRPVQERSSGRAYSKADELGRSYVGRGFVQLTGKGNYARVGKLIGKDLVNHPELANDPGIALEIATRGMMEGWFTGKRVTSYFSDTKSDWYGARSVVNPCSPATHKPILVRYARKFTQCLTGDLPPDQVAPIGPVKGCKK